ncbi:CPBP family intramembrane glutamic endopeptidase [Acidovorax sp.]|uniref:CPBP family intramembrane glutamic endopeptidase n=1 Tax=Acidovorax sp. TaxID=1872122 RepID=UPI00391F621E
MAGGAAPPLPAQGTDFPFYDGRPLALGARQWLAVLLVAMAAYGALHIPSVAAMRVLGGWPALIPALAFPALPLLALRAVAGPQWQQLFRPVGWRDVRLAVGLVLLNIVVTVAVALLVSQLFGAVPNPVVKALAAMGTAEKIVFLACTIPHLIGEEILTVLPFLARLTWLAGPLAWPRRRAIVGAWVVSAVLFGALHLPTYGWNVAQSLVIISVSRMVLWLAYLRTKNLSVASLAHILNDGLLLGLAFLLGALIN